ncbi:hypothetical protein N646_0891 [Vibrio alginolyticus NBRC 15630 = ATCC 17749]|uniref:Uncharacterized protein n=1 Tax=Vibrio alginolyticus (strain ATCC 17749 / DSM 2171 / NBRC 15630 / NCIMB 1903 / NCTC 12160 / XII-53) TaxID=1219076 RepID=A0A2I3C5B6_VIBAX|nr:hypothetical protein N646_0891 [Vibrio alginolyticus NBRC 15630 = ATCC 17749]
MVYFFGYSNKLSSWFQKFNIGGLNSWISQPILSFKPQGCFH